MADAEPPDYMRRFLEFWRPLVTDALGHLDLDKVARELSDYSQLMDEASKVYEHIADLCKPNTSAHHIIAAHEKKLADAYDEGHADARSEVHAAVARASRTRVADITDDELAELRANWADSEAVAREDGPSHA